MKILREERPRLYHPADDPQYRFKPPEDEARVRILGNILADCEEYYPQRPWKRIPERPDSPHPYHQLYLTFYTGMHATALMENYAFAWRLTGDPRWLKRARDWMGAAAAWEHSDRVNPTLPSPSKSAPRLCADTATGISRKTVAAMEMQRRKSSRRRTTCF